MRQYYLMVMLLGTLLMPTSVSGQRIVLKSSTISSSASFYNNSSQNLNLSQVIGQTSSVKISTSHSLQISQGFLQPDYSLLANDNYWKLVVYPNPSSGMVNFKYSKDIMDQVKVLIYDTQGKLLKSEWISIDALNLDLSSLTKGILYVKKHCLHPC